MADLISIIVTTWNREDALDAVLRSLAVQTDRDFEVVGQEGAVGPTDGLGRRLQGVGQPLG